MSGLPMSVLALVATATVLLVACREPDESRRGASESVTDSVAVVSAPAISDTAIVQDRADWDAFCRALPSEPTAAAAALERYRRENGPSFSVLHSFRCTRFGREPIAKGGG